MHAVHLSNTIFENSHTKSWKKGTQELTKRTRKKDRQTERQEKRFQEKKNNHKAIVQQKEHEVNGIGLKDKAAVYIVLGISKFN
jgi:ABC-type Fe2+-enterobactin transport system substrate-binding protein